MRGRQGGGEGAVRGRRTRKNNGITELVLLYRKGLYIGVWNGREWGSQKRKEKMPHSCDFVKGPKIESVQNNKVQYKTAMN